MMWDVQKLLGQLPQPVVTILRQATPTLLEQMTEIRLRSGQPLVPGRPGGSPGPQGRRPGP